jgi:hypothetical protein
MAQRFEELIGGTEGLKDTELTELLARRIGAFSVADIEAVNQFIYGGDFGKPLNESLSPAEETAGQFVAGASLRVSMLRNLGVSEEEIATHWTDGRQIGTAKITSWDELLQEELAKLQKSSR